MGSLLLIFRPLTVALTSVILGLMLKEEEPRDEKLEVIEKMAESIAVSIPTKAAIPKAMISRVRMARNLFAHTLLSAILIDS